MFGHLSSTRKWVTISTTTLLLLAGLTITLFSPVVAHMDTAHADTNCDGYGVKYAGSSWLTSSGGGVNICNPGGGKHYCLAVSNAPGDTNCPKGYVWSGDEWQCVEMVNRLYLTKRWTTATWYGDGGGKNGLIYHLPSNLTDQLQDHISYVHVGDVVTLNNQYDPAGHAGIINTIESNGTIHIKNQNADLDSQASIASGTSLSAGNAHYTLKDWSGYSIQAIVHHPSASTKPGLGGGNGSTWASGRLDGWIAQATPTNGSNLGHIWVDSSWHPWETIPVNTQLMASQPAVVSWAVNRIDIFARGQAGDLIHAWLDSGGWHNWESFGGCIIGAPTVTTWGAGRLDVMAEGCNTTGPNLYHIWLDSGVWHPWEQITATTQRMASPPSAVSWGPGRIDIFSQGTDTSLLHTWLDSSWHDWESKGGCIIGSPAASSWGSGRLDGWAESCNTTGSNFVHIWFDSGAWHPFEAIPSTTQIAGVLGAASWGAGRIDMFTRASDNTLMHWWFNGAWNGQENKGGAIAPY